MAEQLTTRSRGEQGVLRVFRGAKGLGGHLGFILVTLGAIAAALSPLALWWLGVGAVLGVTGLVCEVRVRPNYARLADDAARSRAHSVTLASGIENIVESMLRSVMSELAIDFTVARISIYRHVDRSFVLIARVSQDRALEAVGRRSYPDDQGIISRTWRNGVDHVTGLPEDRDEWNLRCSQDYGIPADVAALLTMQARSLVGERIDLPGTSPVPAGLVVIESLKPRGASIAAIDKLRTWHARDLLLAALQEAVRCLGSAEPTDADAEPGTSCKT